MVNSGEQHSKQSIEITQNALRIVKNLNILAVSNNEVVVCSLCGQANEMHTVEVCVKCWKKYA